MLVKRFEHGDKLIVFSFVKAGLQTKDIIDTANETVLGNILAVFYLYLHKT